MRQEYDTDMAAAGFSESFDRHSNALGHNYSGYENSNRQDNEHWARFEKSGTILDYLTYSACTKEV